MRDMSFQQFDMFKVCSQNILQGVSDSSSTITSGGTQDCRSHKVIIPLFTSSWTSTYYCNDLKHDKKYNNGMIVNLKRGRFSNMIQHIFFLPRITLTQEDKGQCAQMCDSSEILENEKVCNGTAPSQCRTLLSCKDNCACWLNLECSGDSGGQPSNGKVGVDQIQDFVQISVSAGMITDKITLRINRKVSSNDTSVEWKAVAEER